MSRFPIELLAKLDHGCYHDWIVDSGASFHVTLHREWLSTYNNGKNGRVHLGNNYACDIVGKGNIKFTYANGSSFVLKNVRHISKLTKDLISTGHLDDRDYQTTFGFQSWKIQKRSMVLASGAKCGTWYPLHVLGETDNIVAITMQPSTSLWHWQLPYELRME